MPPKDHSPILTWFKKTGVCLTKEHMVVTGDTLKLVRDAIKSKGKERHSHSLVPTLPLHGQVQGPDMERKQPKPNSIDWHTQMEPLGPIEQFLIDSDKYPKDTGSGRRSSSVSSTQDTRTLTHCRSTKEEFSMVEVHLVGTAAHMT